MGGPKKVIPQQPVCACPTKVAQGCDPYARLLSHPDSYSVEWFNQNCIILSFGMWGFSYRKLGVFCPYNGEPSGRNVENQMEAGLYGS